LHSLPPKADSNPSVKPKQPCTPSPSAASLRISVFSQNSQQVLHNTGYSNKQVRCKRNFKCGIISRSKTRCWRWTEDPGQYQEHQKYGNVTETFRKKEQEIPVEATNLVTLNILQRQKEILQTHSRTG